MTEAQPGEIKIILSDMVMFPSLVFFLYLVQVIYGPEVKADLYLAQLTTVPTGLLHLLQLCMILMILKCLIYQLDMQLEEIFLQEKDIAIRPLMEV